MAIMDFMRRNFVEMLSYKTVKLVKTYDKTLITMHFICMSCIMGFTFFSIVVFHSYKMFEIPRVDVSHRLIRTDFDATRGNTSNLRYCGGTGNDLVDYVDGTNGNVYSDPQCVTSLDPSEFTEQNVNTAWVLTHVRQRTVVRACAGANTTIFVPCSEMVNNTADAFTVHVEALKLHFAVKVETSWGMDQVPDELTIKYPSGATIISHPKATGKDTTLSVAQLLELAGVDLDAPSESAVGTAAVFNQVRAPHRLMGLRLKVMLLCTNVNPWRPFDDSLHVTLTVESAPVTERLGPATRVIYTGGGVPGSLNAHDQTRVERDWSGIFVEFQEAGSVGVTDVLTTIVAVTNAFVLIGMATFAVDFVGMTISSSFYDDKYEDDGEREILENISDHLENPAHRDVPFDPKNLRLMNDMDDQAGMSYENAIYTLMNQLREVEDRLSMIPEEEAEFVEGSAPGRQPEGILALRLVEEQTDEGLTPQGELAQVELHQGAQMMGRGVGSVVSKAVSRQQFTLTVVKDKIRMKALRDGPGYMLEDAGRFENLKAGKAVVLKTGDRVVFRMREGKQGGHLGVYRIAEAAEQKKSFFSILLGC